MITKKKIPVEAVLAIKAIDRAIKGDNKFWNDIMDRIYGKPTEYVETNAALMSREQIKIELEFNRKPRRIEFRGIKRERRFRN